MDLDLDESQQLIAETFAEFFTQECPSTLVRDCEESGFSPELWANLAELGAIGMGLPEDVGGVGAGLLELGIVSGLAGRSLAPVPFVEAAVSGRALASIGADAALLDRLASGSERASVAIRVAGSGPASSVLVPAGSIADSVLALDGDALVLVSDPDSRRSGALENLGSMPLSRWDLGERGDDTRQVLATGNDARLAAARIEAEWRLLTAFSLVGLAQQALSIGADYARERIQFGVPIGGFQGIAHPLADCATRVDGAELLAWEAAWAESEEPERFEELASMAFIFASQTAQRTSAVSLHTHGGYGFSLEYDIQLYYRRACAWSLMGGGPREELVALADRRFGSGANEDQAAVTGGA